MSDKVFIDSNIWLYAFIQAQNVHKHRQAQKLLVQELPIVVTPQVINEVCYNLIKKAGFQEDSIQELIKDFYRDTQVSPFTQYSFTHASVLRKKYSFSFWDSLIVSSALQAGCRVLLTEDMQDGMLIEETLRIQNPFRSQP